MSHIWLVIYVSGVLTNSYPPLEQTWSNCQKRSNELMNFAKDAGYSYEFFHAKCEIHDQEPIKGTPG